MNTIDYQNKQVTLTEQEWLDNRKLVHPPPCLKEEFKFEGEDEIADLSGGDQQQQQLEQLKDMFKMSKYQRFLTGE